MKRFCHIGWGLCAVAGLILGTLLAWHAPPPQSFATATDRVGNIEIATGYIDDNREAVFFLDYTTGRLAAGLLSSHQRGFQATYETDLSADFQGAVAQLNQRGGYSPIELPAEPQFMMVTGMADLGRAARRNTISRSVLYVAEANTGVVLVYALPVPPQIASGTQSISGLGMELWAFDQFSVMITRE